MIIGTFPSGPFATNAYIVACPETQQAAIIDPAPDSAGTITAYLEKKNLKPAMILITHTHWDHIGDTDKLKALYQVPIYVNALDAPNLQKPGSDGLPSWAQMEGIQPDILLNDGDTIKLGNLSFKAIHTPGHTPGGLCFYCDKEQVLFSGDTLFKGSIGNLSLPTSDPKQMWPSLDKLAKLPPKTTVYPGHGKPTTIENEHWLPRAREIFN